MTGPGSPKSGVGDSLTLPFRPLQSAESSRVDAALSLSQVQIFTINVGSPFDSQLCSPEGLQLHLAIQHSRDRYSGPAVDQSLVLAVTSTTISTTFLDLAAFRPADVAVLDLSGVQLWAPLAFDRPLHPGDWPHLALVGLDRNMVVAGTEACLLLGSLAPLEEVQVNMAGALTSSLHAAEMLEVSGLVLCCKAAGATLWIGLQLQADRDRMEQALEEWDGGRPECATVGDCNLYFATMRVTNQALFDLSVCLGLP